MKAILAFLFGLLSVAQATTYYVRGNGVDTNTGTADTSGSAWRTIQKAFSTCVAGDVCYVQYGAYPERVSPGASGTIGSPITFIANGGLVLFGGLDIASKNYVRMSGFVEDGDVPATRNNRAVNVSGTCTGWEFFNCSFRDSDAGISSGSYSDRAQNFIVTGCSFKAIGGLGGANGSATSLIGNDCLVAFCDVDTPNPDAFIGYGQRNRWLNNTIHNVVDPSDHHADAVQTNSHTLGLSFNLFEGNLIIGNGNLPNEHGVLIQNQGGAGPCEGGACGAVTENLFRRNVFYNISSSALGADQALTGSITETRFINNAVVDMQRFTSSITYSVIFNGTGTITGRVHNTIFYRGWSDNISTGIECFTAVSGATINSADYNLAYSPSGSVTFAAAWNAQAHKQSNIDPQFVNISGYDFRLQAASGARNNAGPLATTSGSGTGTTFNVVAGGGGSFRGNSSISQYSGLFAPGDIINVGGDVVTIASISTDAITTTTSFTWANGESVYEGASATPDIGPIPFGAVFLSGATITNVGTAYTVVPTGDARLVMFFENGIPMAVDTTSPYQYTSSGGTVTAYAGARWAQRNNLWVAATTETGTATVTTGTVTTFNVTQ